MARLKTCGNCGKTERECGCGPLPYTEMGAMVAKFRRSAAEAGSVMSLSREERVAYANAVEAAVRAKHNAWWKAGASIAVPAAPKRGEVGARIRAEHARSLASCGERERAARSVAEIEKAYAEAMAEKRKAAALTAKATAEKSGYTNYWEGSATASVASSPAVTVKAGAAKKAVNWSEAGRKAWATRKANEAARAAGKAA